MAFICEICSTQLPTEKELLAHHQSVHKDMVMNIDLDEVLNGLFNEKSADAPNSFNIDEFLTEAVCGGDEMKQTEEELGRLFDETDCEMERQAHAEEDLGKLFEETDCEMERQVVDLNRRFNCQFCKRKFTRQSYKQYHEKHCVNEQQQQPSRKQAKMSTQIGGGDDDDGNLFEQHHPEVLEIPKIIASSVSNVAVSYRKEFDTDNKLKLFERLNNVVNMFKDTIILETDKKKAIKYFFTIKLVFHKNKDEDELSDPPISFRSTVFTILPSNRSEVDQHLKSVQQQFVQMIETFQRNGSDWVLDHIIHLDLGVVQYDPLRASTYIPLPKKIKNRRACINIHNRDNKCFVWSILASLHPAASHSDRVASYRPFEHELDMNGIQFPVKTTDITRFEGKNNISVNVYGLDDDEELTVFPIRISDVVNARHHVDLLYISEEEIGHYVWIKDLSRLVRRQITRRENRIHICKYCLHGCSSRDILEKHMERCQLHGAQRIKMPKEGENKLYFKKIECQLRLPFVIYADFESILQEKDVEQQTMNQPWTVQYQSHKACSFGMHTVSTDKRFYSKPKIYFGEDCGEAFLDAIMCEANRIRKFLNYKVPMIRLTPAQWRSYRIESTCHICKKEITSEQKKVRDHDHLTGI